MQSVLSAGANRAIIKELPKNSVIFASSEPTNKWHNLLVWRATHSKSLRCNIRHLSPPNLPQFGSLQGKGGCCPFGLSLKAFSPFGEPAIEACCLSCLSFRDDMPMFCANPVNTMDGKMS